jgi:hypothetical protein
VVVEACVFWNNTTIIGGGIGGAIAGAGPGTIMDNTFVSNGAAGGGSAAFFQFGTIGLMRNIVAGSVGAEAVHAFQASVTDDCNVYWNNAGGNTSGFTMAATSREVDPLFCGQAIGDFTVAQDSPCLPANSAGCGLIGALGEGCGSVSVEQRSWGTIKGGYR